MNINRNNSAISAYEIDEAIESACARIAPTWPLDRFIAVNPFWGSVERPISEVAAELSSLSGAQLLMPRVWFREAREQGRLLDEDLLVAIERSRSSVTLSQLSDLLNEEDKRGPVRFRVTDVVDTGRDTIHELSWREFVKNSVSQMSASYFDEGQAVFGPDRTGGLYATWRRHALVDNAPLFLMGLRTYRTLVAETPHSAREMIDLGLAKLGIPKGEWALYLAALLLDINGWASWCMYRKWTAELSGGDDHTVVDLLAIRLAWEWLLFRTCDTKNGERWKQAMQTWPKVDAAARAARSDDWIFQSAMEIAWQRQISVAIPQGLTTTAPSDVAVQAVFCIDVRSEVFRRALEAQSHTVQTLGFAGFFGLPIEYQPLGTTEGRPQLPGLLQQRLRVTDTGMGDAATRRTDTLNVKRSWKRFRSDAISSFTFVEAIGLSYLGQLISDGFGLGAVSEVDAAGLSKHDARIRKPRLTESTDGTAIGLEAKCDLAAGILRAMSLTSNFARLVLLAGHGSETRNNPHAAGLDCGACCGQTGEVNARATAALLNEFWVRHGLALRGIVVPSTTHFVSGLHITTTDDVKLFDLDELPSSHETDLLALRKLLESAAVDARRERAKMLDIGPASPSETAEAVRNRSRDWAQVRPEWGLANNAAFIIAPREHCRHLNLQGRSFLHEYRYEQDTNFEILELIMTAPMVVTHWINMQYYASTVDNERYGSGNKVLHNVVGGHIGVFEGNSGDLRTGLPMQSLHDGKRWVHTPLRLSVFIEAPSEAIEAVLKKHDKIRALVVNGWISIFQIDATAGTVFHRQPVGWVRANGG